MTALGASGREWPVNTVPFERGDLVAVDRPDSPLRYGVVLDKRVKFDSPPQPGMPAKYTQILVRYEDGSRGWCWALYVHRDDDE